MGGGYDYWIDGELSRPMPIRECLMLCLSGLVDESHTLRPLQSSLVLTGLWLVSRRLLFVCWSTRLLFAPHCSLEAANLRRAKEFDQMRKNTALSSVLLVDSFGLLSLGLVSSRFDSLVLG